MYEVLMFNKKEIDNSKILKKLDLKKQNYFLVIAIERKILIQQITLIHS